MATNRLTRLTALGWQEWRRFRFSPVWIIGLVCGGFLAINESGASRVTGYPTANEALSGFQLASSTVFGFIGFLLAAGSLAADLEGSRKALIFSRPIAKLEFLLAKFTGVFFLALATILPVLLLSVSSPLLYGTWKLHALGPFLKVMLLGTIPMLAYVAALALMLTAVFRRVLIVLPVFIVYFFTAGLSGSGASGHIDLFDFSMRLYPH